MRYGQIAVPDFLEFLAGSLSSYFNQIRFQLSTKLQCLQCKWVSYTNTQDVLFKIYIPSGSKNHYTLSELFDYNTSAVLSGRSTLCGKCCRKTEQQINLEHDSDIIVLEIIRVSPNLRSPGWKKSTVSISFPLFGFSVPGTTRKYRIIATCHHRGGLSYGHWTTKLATARGDWYECDDLRPGNRITQAPGTYDSSVVILLLVADSLFTHSS